MKTEDAKALRR